MIYIIVLLSGAMLGLLLILGAGIPVITLRYFHLLPLDRRLWWTVAALVAARLVHQISMAQNDYLVPSGNEQLAAFNAYRWGGFASVGLVWLFGYAVLAWVGNENGQDPISKIAWPVAAVVLFLGAFFSFDQSEVRRQEIEDQRLAVVAALKSGDIETLGHLISDGEKLHQPLKELDDCEPFKYAIKQQNIKLIKFFLDRPKSDRPDLKVWMSDMMVTENQEIIGILFDELGRDPASLGHAMNVAVSNDARVAFDRAMELGGDPNYMYSYTALMIAAKQNKIDYAIALINSGANVDAVHDSSWGKTNRTALSFAAEKGNSEIVAILLDHKANPTIPDAEGRLPIEWARSRDHDDVVSLLELAARPGEQRGVQQ